MDRVLLKDAEDEFCKLYERKQACLHAACQCHDELSAEGADVARRVAEMYQHTYT